MYSPSNNPRPRSTTRVTRRPVIVPLDMPTLDDHPLLNSFPTRRSSYLARRGRRGSPARVGESFDGLGRGRTTRRSEEHTSELQSLRHLVCGLLLEKKQRGMNLVELHIVYADGGSVQSDWRHEALHLATG